MQEYPSDATMQLVKPQSTAPEEEKQQIKCPRCESANTKFCYYNNYNLSQPRHFCKDCRRYWTKGGSLRNVPVGGGIRKKTKRPYYSAAAAAAFDSKPKPLSSSALSDSPDRSFACFQPPKDPYSEMYPSIDQDDRMGEITGSFSSLLESDGNFRSLLDTHHLGSSRVEGLPTSSELNRSICAPGLELQSSNDSSGSENPTLQQDTFLSLQGDSSYWTWPDLAIYTPSSSFQ